MVVGNELSFDDRTEFQSLSKGKMSLSRVFDEIIDFIKADTHSSYRISIGTDSQVGAASLFVTCIHVHRVGKGAIGFLHKHEMERPVNNLAEKIYLETCISLQLAYMFDEQRIDSIYKALGKADRNTDIVFEFHIDVGTKGETRKLINEMTGMVKGTNFITRIKPDSYCASTFADRYTKAV